VDRLCLITSEVTSSLGDNESISKDVVTRVLIGLRIIHCQVAQRVEIK